LCAHYFRDRMVSITPFAAPAAGNGEMIRFGSLEFPAIPRDGSWAPPPFPPSQTFQFGSLEFITDQLGALHLHEEEAAPADTEEPAPPPKPRNLRRRRSVRWRVKKHRPSQPTRAVLHRISLMMASNPAVEDVNLVCFSLANVSQQLAGGPPLVPPRSFSEQLPFGLRNAASVYAREVRKAAQRFQPTSQFVGMTESYPDSIHDLLCYENPLSDSSCTGDNRPGCTSVPQCMCAMADGDPPQGVAPAKQTRTPPDQCEHALANTQAHDEDPPISNRRIRPWNSLHGSPPGLRV